jgi:hypothetical protein
MNTISNTLNQLRKTKVCNRYCNSRQEKTVHILITILIFYILIMDHSKTLRIIMINIVFIRTNMEDNYNLA